MEKKRLLFPLLLVAALSSRSSGASTPDFRVSDIIISNDQFIAVKLENTSAAKWTLTAEAKEHVFLTIYVDQVKRAEYRAKYVDSALFLPHSLILFKTNFRGFQPLRIRVEINRDHFIPESDFRNNALEKDLSPNSG